MSETDPPLTQTDRLRILAATWLTRADRYDESTKTDAAIWHIACDIYRRVAEELTAILPSEGEPE